MVFVRSQLTNHPRTLHITFTNQPDCGSNRGANGAHSVADAVLPVAVLHLEELDERVGHLISGDRDSGEDPHDHDADVDD